MKKPLIFLATLSSTLGLLACLAPQTLHAALSSKDVSLTAISDQDSPIPDQTENGTVTPYTGGESKQVDDLKIWGAVGSLPMTWSRLGSSLAPGGSSLFGNAYYWRHSFQWELLPASTNSAGNPQLTLINPQGGQYTLVERTPGVWTSLQALTDLLVPTATGFELRHNDGSKGIFQQFSSGKSAYYLMVSMVDASGNAYSLQYDSYNNLTRVAEPAGRSFSVAYTNLTAGSTVTNNTVTFIPPPIGGSGGGAVAAASLASTSAGGTYITNTTYTYVTNTIRAIQSVTTSDGRTVTYNYTNFHDPSVPYLIPSLTSVSYEDGSQATYGLTQVSPGTRPLVSLWNDPRATTPMGRYQSVYATDVIGDIVSQINLDTGGTILTRGHKPGTVVPIVTYANGGVVTQTFINRVNTNSLNSKGNPYKLDVELVSRQDANGNTVSYTYDTNGFVISMKDGLGNITSYTRDAQGNPLTKTYPDGSVESWSYNTQESVISHTDQLGNTTTLSRDASNRVIGISYPDGSSESFSYNSFGEPLSHTLRNGSTESFTYDARGLIQSKSDAAGNVTSYGYDSHDRLNSVTDANGHTTTMSYNSRGLLTQIVSPDGSSKNRSYTFYGDVQSETNELGQSWNYTYDTFRRVTSVTDPLSRVKTFAYQPDSVPNNPLSVTFPSGRTTLFAYDLNWNLLSKTEGAGTADASTNMYVYDANSNIQRSTNANGHATVFGYDTLNRLSSVTDSLNHTTSRGYDAAGNVTSITKADGTVTTNSYDVMNRPVSSTDASGNTTSFSYDASGNMTNLTELLQVFPSGEHEPVPHS